MPFERMEGPYELLQLLRVVGWTKGSPQSLYFGSTLLFKDP